MIVAISAGGDPRDRSVQPNDFPLQPIRGVAAKDVNRVGGSYPVSSARDDALTVQQTRRIDSRARNPRQTPAVPVAQSRHVQSSGALQDPDRRRSTPEVRLGAIQPLTFSQTTPQANALSIQPAVPQQTVTFRTKTAAPATDAASRRIESRLIGMERQLDRLAQAEPAQSGFGLQDAASVLQQLQERLRLQGLESQMHQIQAMLQRQSPTPDQSAPDADGSLPSDASSADSADPVLKAERSELGGERFSLQFQEAEIAQAMDMLGQLSGENILLGKNVKGMVTANLQDVTIEEALSAILRSLGYVHLREGRFIFIVTSEEAATRQRLARKLITKIYRPNYISVSELQSLITPLLTQGISKIAITNPPEAGIAADAENAGGDRLTQRDALLVQDYAEVLLEIDAVMEEMDVPPLQVVIEAMIFSVRLDDSLDLGVNFALLGKNSKSLTVSGNGQTLNESSGFPGVDDTILPPAGQFIADAAGLKFGFIQGDVSAFVEALENLSDTNLVAAPQLRVLNKHKAELIIGDRISYRTLAFNGTQTAENVQFLDSGTKLLFRPYISPDGMVRMEVHPERSSAVIDQQTGLPNQTTTEVTTNVMVRDGTTVVIGGLIEEQVVESYERVPLLGAMPVVGRVFRNKSESIVRSELIVLITPRIVREPTEVEEGNTVAFENDRRHEGFRDNLAAINRRNLARIHFERALLFFEKGELDKALHHVEKSLLQNKNSLDSLRLRDDILAAIQEQRPEWMRVPWESESSEQAVEPALP